MDITKLLLVASILVNLVLIAYLVSARYLIRCRVRRKAHIEAQRAKEVASELATLDGRSGKGIFITY